MPGNRIRYLHIFHIYSQSPLPRSYKLFPSTPFPELPGTPQPAASDLSLVRLGGTLLQQLLGRPVGGHVQTALPGHWAGSFQGETCGVRKTSR